MEAKANITNGPTSLFTNTTTPLPPTTDMCKDHHRLPSPHHTPDPVPTSNNNNNNNNYCIYKDKDDISRDADDEKACEEKGHRHKDKLVRINICGSVYVTWESTLTFFPETLLGSREKEKFFIEELGMYYFNRSRAVFDSILYFYQSRGIFKPPANIDDDIVQYELEFFQISLDEIFGAVAEPKETTKYPKQFKNKVREFLNNPHYSKGACTWAVIDIVFICISLALLVLETVPSVRRYFSDSNEPLYVFFLVLDTTVIAFFTVDLFLRMFSWKNILKFLALPMHIMDLLSILPFFIGLIADLVSEESDNDTTKTHGYVALRVCRTFRIIRIFKFVRHSKELIVVMKVMSGAAKEFMVLLLLILIFVLSCGTIMYYIEYEQNSEFKSILEGCWWAVVTITTVGYGDVAPETHLGRMFGSVVVVMGIVILALPMTIIVSKFSSSYDEEKRALEKIMIDKLRKSRDPHYNPNKPFEYDPDLTNRSPV